MKKLYMTFAFCVGYLPAQFPAFPKEKIQSLYAQVKAQVSENPQCKIAATTFYPVFSSLLSPQAKIAQAGFAALGASTIFATLTPKSYIPQITKESNELFSNAVLFQTVSACSMLPLVKAKNISSFNVVRYSMRGGAFAAVVMLAASYTQSIRDHIIKK